MEDRGREDRIDDVLIQVAKKLIILSVAAVPQMQCEYSKLLFAGTAFGNVKS